MEKCPVRKCVGGLARLPDLTTPGMSQKPGPLLKTLSAVSRKNDTTRRCRRVVRFAYWISGASDRDPIPA